jgi:probable phosphoglycerate mutase
MSALKIVFIRHAETAWSVSGRHTGHTDLPLTPHGEAAARGLLPTLDAFNFNHVLTSPRLRARITCSLAGFGAGAVTEPLLAEWDFGDYGGLSTAEIRRLHPAWDLWRHGCPNGEMPGDISGRADLLVSQLLELSGCIALFSHGQLGRALAARWIGQAASLGQHFALDTASVSVLRLDAAHPPRPVIALWNAPGSGLLDG